MKRIGQKGLLLLGVLWASVCLAEEQPVVTLDQDVQALKLQVIELNRDLLLLEEELLYPPRSQVAVYLSLDVDDFFQLDTVELRIDNKVVTHYLYTAQQLSALQRGGVQRLYLGILPQGEHQLSAFFIGKGPRQRDYKRAVSHQLIKTDEALQLELKIVASEQKYQPNFQVKQW